MRVYSDELPRRRSAGESISSCLWYCLYSDVHTASILAVTRRVGPTSQGAIFIFIISLYFIIIIFIFNLIISIEQMTGAARAGRTI